VTIRRELRKRLLDELGKAQAERRVHHRVAQHGHDGCVRRAAHPVDTLITLGSPLGIQEA